MRGNNYARELENIIPLMELQPGDHFLDAQAEPDTLLVAAAKQVTPYGRAVGLVYGQRVFKQVAQKIEAQKQFGVSVKLGHITRIPFKGEAFNVVLYRNTRNMRNFRKVISEAHRVTNYHSRIIVCHLHWEYELPDDAPAEVRQALRDLSSPAFADGVEFMNAFKKHDWRDVSFDAYTLASNNHRKAPETRYHGDWTTLCREILVHEKYYTHEAVQAVIGFVEQHQVPIRADRYLGIGTRT